MLCEFIDVLLLLAIIDIQSFDAICLVIFLVTDVLLKFL